MASGAAGHGASGARGGPRRRLRTGAGPRRQLVLVGAIDLRPELAQDAVLSQPDASDRGPRGSPQGWRLHHAARLKRIRIIRCGHPGHEPCGDSFVRPFYQAHYLPTTCRWLVGENLAWGWSTAWGAFDALMHSPTHRANILDGTFSTYGASHSASPWGRLWVIHYGDRC